MVGWESTDIQHPIPLATTTKDQITPPTPPTQIIHLGCKQSKARSHAPGFKQALTPPPTPRHPPDHTRPARLAPPYNAIP